MPVCLQVWSRQVGLVLGTWCLMGSSADHMVAITARRSRGRFLGWVSKLRSSRYDVGVESWVEIGGRLHQVCRVSSDSPHNHCVTRLSYKTKAEDSTRRGRHPSRSNHPEGVVWPPKSQCRDPSKWRTHNMIARVALVLCRLAVDAHLSDGAELKTSKIALEGHVSLLC
jgi:hypothetical protein